METVMSGIKHHSVRLVAIIVSCTFYQLAQLPTITRSERNMLASHFAFTRLPMPELADSAFRVVREVHPSLAHFSSWISAVSASVALNDLDGDGLVNDMCFVESRAGQVLIAPVPGRVDSYAAFELVPAPLPFDARTMLPTGCLVGDFNEDGFTDVLVYYFGRTPVVFLHQGTATRPHQRQHYIPRELTSSQQRWYTTTATQADLDGDGHVDLIFGNYFLDDSRMLDAQASGVEEMQHSLSRAMNGGSNRLFRWIGATRGAEPTVIFEEVAGALSEQQARAWTLAVGAADLDGDLLPELYFANDFGPDVLLHNRSRPAQLRFVPVKGSIDLRTPKSKVLGRDSFKGMGVDFGDINGDGLLDIFVSNLTSERALIESHFVFVSTGEIQRFQDGIAPYVDRSEQLGMARSGWAWGTRFGDFNNDGVLETLQATGFVKGSVHRWPEFQEWGIGNDTLISVPKVWPHLRPGDDLSGHEHNPFYVRARDGRYYDIATQLQLDHPYVSRGIATADVDDDGDLDFAIANQWEPSFFFRNDSPNPGRFLGLHLRRWPGAGAASAISVQPGHPAYPGSQAMGASVSVRLPDGTHQVAQVDGGNGHAGSRSPALHFGLGDLQSNAQLTVELAWRDAQGTVHHDTLLMSPGWYTVWLGIAL